MRAFIKTTTESSLFEQARIGFIKMGYECVYYEDTPSDLSCEDILVGYIADTHKAFLKLGVAIPQSIDYPEELYYYLARKIEKIKYSDLKQNYPYFIKPINHKQFPGRIIKEFKDLIGIPETDLYYTETILDIQSEYRVYVKDKEIIGIKHYKGNPYLIPQEKTIKEMIDKYTSQNSTYTLDIGILKYTQLNILIEVNDGGTLREIMD